MSPKYKMWSRNIWEWSSFKSIFAALGFLWTIVKIITFIQPDTTAFFQSMWWMFVILPVIYLIYVKRPIIQISYPLKNRDVRIELRIGDMFEGKGDLIIPANTTFDTDIQDGIISEKSTQGQFQKKYNVNISQLNDMIADELKEENYTEVKDAPGNKKRYAIGATCKCEFNGVWTYLVAIADINEHKTAVGSFQNIRDALPALWQYIGERGRKEELLIPIIGTGFSRIAESRESVIREIIKSFTAACSEKVFTQKLVIYISEKDYDEHNIDFSELKRFLEFQCDYTEFVSSSDRGGGEALIT